MLGACCDVLRVAGSAQQTAGPPGAGPPVREAARALLNLLRQLSPSWYAASQRQPLTLPTRPLAPIPVPTAAAGSATQPPGGTGGAGGQQEGERAQLWEIGRRMRAILCAPVLVDCQPLLGAVGQVLAALGAPLVRGSRHLTLHLSHASS
jgi:hypothetical protein